MDTADSPHPHHELARLPELPPALRASLPPMAQPAGSGGGLSISPRLVLRGLARHWWQALALWIVGTAALAALVYLRFEPTYRSSSLVRIDVVGTNPYNNTGARILGDPLQTQIQLITSPNVLSAAAAALSTANVEGLATAVDAEAYLRDLIWVDPLPGGSLIQVSAELPQEGDAARVVNAVVAAFKAANADWAKARTEEAIVQHEEYQKKLEGDIKAKQEELIQLIEQAEHPAMVNQYLSRQGGVGGEADGEEGGEFVVEVDEYNRQLKRMLDLQFEETEARAELEAARRQAAATDPQVWVERQIERVFLADPNVRDLREQLADVDAQLKAAQRRIRNPGDPSLSRMKDQKRRLLERYEQLWADMEPSLRAKLTDFEGNPTQIVRQAEARLASLASTRALVKQQLDQLDIDQRSRGTDALKISFATNEHSQLQGMLAQVKNRLEALRFEESDDDQIQVISPAKDTGVAQASKRDKYLALTPLGVLGLVLGLVTLVEMRAGRVGGTEELSGRLAAEVFAVPPLPTARPSSQGRLEGPGPDPKFEQFVQQLDHLRVALCGEGGHDGRGRCVLITSAVGGEGKTTLAAQLAVRCAEAGASTVLIDADLRHATLGRLFEVPDCPGLSDVLRGDARLEDALAPITQVGGCQLLPAGSPEPNPNRILRGKAFAPMLEQLRRSFDVVIIDTSPVLPVPDALILGRLADGAVLAARHDQSRFPAVERANGLLAGAGIPVLGVVVNGARPSDRRFGGAGYAAYTYRSDRMPNADEPSVG